MSNSKSCHYIDRTTAELPNNNKPCTKNLFIARLGLFLMTILCCSLNVSFVGANQVSVRTLGQSSADLEAMQQSMGIYDRVV